MKIPSGVVTGEGEEVKAVLSPHLLAFGRYYSLEALYLAEAGLLLFGFSNITSILSANEPLAFASELIVWWLALMIPAFVAGLLWVSKQPPFYAFLTGVLGTVALFQYGNPTFMLPLVLSVASLLGIFLTEIYRRGHRYVITDRRILMVKKFVGSTTRELRLERVTDLAVIKGLLGRVFGFGTIIPVSESGFGLGEDTAGAAIGAGYTRGRITVGGGVFGSKGVSVPRSATYFSLYGVPKVESVHSLLSNLIHSASQVEILKDIREHLSEGATVRPTTETLAAKKTDLEKKTEEAVA